MKKAEMIAGIVLLVLSGAVIWGASEMPPSATFGPGAGFLPFWLGIVLAILATILLATAWHRQPTKEDSKPVFPGKHALFTIVLVLVGLGVYIELIDILGYILDTFLFVIYLVKVVERQKWPLSLAVAVCTAAGLFIVFQVLLEIILPSNMFGF
ncbi:MAG: tripartite tricarboxylate transporter TctB family protein [Deltaproteobacteria bacterium]|nr:tripartite tricarboxylate transporter TctB family protein [Deltaproteobacteria bacterium]